MKIRRYTDSDFKTVSFLFYDTIHTVNVNDYTPKQLSAWAPNPNCLTRRRNDLLNQNTLVAEIEDTIVGFGSINQSGCFDLLFVHKEYQRRGIATALCNELEHGFSVIQTFASLTAKPFFEQRGYHVIKAQEAERSGIKLKNYEMRKINFKQTTAE